MPCDLWVAAVDHDCGGHGVANGAVGLSPFFFKYDGSVLWAMAVYWLIAACFPGLSAVEQACVAAAATAAIEFSRLWQIPSVDAFRLTPAEKAGVAGNVPGIGNAWAVTPGWFDYNNDGLLELLVVNYFEL